MTNLREKYINETGLDFESDLKNIGFFSDGYVNWLEEIIEMLIHNSKDLYEIITWPDVQELMEEEGFDDNSVLINNEKLIENKYNSHLNTRIIMIKKAVKTEQKAIDIISRNLIDNDGATEQSIYPTEGRCECGETKAFEGLCEGGSVLLKVNVCDGCGDDNAFEDEVILGYTKLIF